MSGNAPVFALLTDFGLADPYVGQLKAALFSRAPSVPVLDISHGVPPYAIATGAFFLAVSRKYYPRGTIFICVVDPGVGSGRELLCVMNEEHTLLGPDNGLLSLAYRDMLAKSPVSVHTLISPVNAGEAGTLAANTFHGRDILAPAAAALALGSAPDGIGARPRGGLPMPVWAEAEHESGEIRCSVLHTDRFGNCILNLPNGEDLLLYPRLSLSIPKTSQNTALFHAGHYAELPPGTLGLIPGGQGYYEIALAGASAAALLGLAPGDACCIQGGLWRTS
jgi:Uncharacterized conserved protein